MSALLTDLYQLTILQAYLERGMHDTAVFELFVRRLPPQRRFLIAAGLEQALSFLENLVFSNDDLQWLSEQRRFSPALLDYLANFHFNGDVDAMPEGSVFFGDEPVLRVTAPIPQAQFVESRLLNLIHFQTLIASKAARVVLAGQRRQLIDFGMRRAHGEEAALYAARAAYLAGFDGTATVEAGKQFGIPLFGTMSHAFVEAHDSEDAAFEAFAHIWPDHPTLIIDTYDAQAAAARLAAMAPRLSREGVRLGGVRIDSGDLLNHARHVRGILDAGGLHDARIVASGNLDEHRIAALLDAGAPIDGFGVGVALGTSSDVPALDAVYKLQSYAGAPRRKRSEGKATWPGVKQVCRRYNDDGSMACDRIHLSSEPPAGACLLRPFMRGGRRVHPPVPVQLSRSHCADQMRFLSPFLRKVDVDFSCDYPVEVSPAIRDLAAHLDARTPIA